MNRRSKPLPVELITNQSQIAELCHRAEREQRFAFDTEFVMEDRFEPEVCLVQIAGADTVSIIDPYLPLDLSPVWSLVSDEDIEVVVHAGQEDLAMCVQHSGKLPHRVYDVQIAAGFAGHDYPLSLQKLVQQILHIRLHKSKTLTDWRKRPLTEAQLTYAAEDVAHLLTVRDALDEKLQTMNRQAWAGEEFARFEDETLYHRAEVEKLTRVKGAGGLQGRQLAVMRELLAWREKLAKKWNRPVRIVIKDYLLLEIAKHELSRFSEIRDLRGLNLSDRDVRDLCKVVAEALKIPEDQWPVKTRRETETPREAVLIALMTAVIRSYCEDHDLAYGLAATKRSIWAFLRYVGNERAIDPDEVELLRGWRGQTLGTMVMELMQGRRVLRVGRKDGEPVLRLSPSKN